MDVPVIGLCGFLGILPVVSVPQLSGTVGACLAQCWWTVVFPLNPSIREALLSSRSPEEGLATQGATHTHYQLHGLLCSIFTASGHLRKRVPAQYLGKMSPGQGTTTERPAESWHQSPDAGSPCKLATVSHRSLKVCRGINISELTGDAVRCTRGTLDLEVWVYPILSQMMGC